MGIKVIYPGPLTTVQDRGRTGYQQFGIPVCGVMDRAAFAAANEILDNDRNAAVLEMTLAGGTFEFTEDHVIALTGADMGPRLDGEEVPMYAPVFARKGGRLALGMAAEGCRCYLGVRGGFDLPPVMGSRSTDLKSATGGFKGRKLEAGDLLPAPSLGFEGFVPKNIALDRPVYKHHANIRVVEGPQEYAFTAKGLETFYDSVYALTDKCDRMGYRLAGAVIETGSGSDIISDGIAFGSVQVPASGQPIILMADRQTTGGYAKIATVCSADLPLLAQLKPGDTIRFERISVEEAQSLALRGIY